MSKNIMSGIQKIFSLVERIGVQKSIRVLEKHCQVSTDDKILKDNYELVLTEVSTRYELPYEEVMWGKGRSNERPYAAGMVLFFMSTYFKYDHLDICQTLKIKPSYGYYCIRKIKTLDKKIFHHEKHINIKNTIEEKLQNLNNEKISN